RNLRQLDHRITEVIDDEIVYARPLEVLARGVVLLLRDVNCVENSAGGSQRRGPEKAAKSIAGSHLDDELRPAGQRDLVEQFALDARDLPGIVARLAQGVDFIDQGGKLWRELHVRWHGRPARGFQLKTWAGRPCHVGSF